MRPGVCEVFSLGFLGPLPESGEDADITDGVPAWAVVDRPSFDLGLRTSEVFPALRSHAWRASKLDVRASASLVRTFGWAIRRPFTLFCRCPVENKRGRIRGGKGWEVVTDNLQRAGWNCGRSSSTDHEGRQFWVAGRGA